LAYRPKFSRPYATAAIISILAFGQSCRRDDRAIATNRNIEPIYNSKSGRLEQLKYDSDGDGKFDTFSYMDGPTILRIEIDQNGDGKIDRWEYYGPGKVLERVGLSRDQSGVEDVSQYLDQNGAVARIEITARSDGDKRIERIEHYENSVLTRAEEDTDHDGAIDKWETYDGGRLAIVAFDETRRGTPTRKILYNANGTVRIEVDSMGDGRFVAQPVLSQTTRRTQ